MKKDLLRGMAVIACLVTVLFINTVSAQNKSIPFSTTRFINIPNGGAGSVLNFTNDSFTLEAWIRPSAFFANGSNNIMGNDSTNVFDIPYAGYGLKTGAGRKLSFYYYYGSGTREVATATGTLDTGMWQHVAVTKRGGDIVLYLNGQVAANMSFATNLNITPSTKTMKIGDNGTGGYRRFLGNIDEVKIWQVARTQAQVQADMSELCGTLPSGLIAYYKLDDTGTAPSNPIACATTTTLNGVYNGVIVQQPGAILFNGGLTELYVDSSNTSTLCGAQDGASWNTAFSDLNKAIEVAQTHPPIRKIFVAKGTYHPANFPYDIKPTGKGAQLQSTTNKDKTFNIGPGVALHGGYPAGGGIANPSLHRTILDGSKAGGVVTDTAYNVVLMYNEYARPDTTKLTGVTVRNGHADLGGGLSLSGAFGGGVYCRWGKSLIQNCVFTNNRSLNGGTIAVSSYATALVLNDSIYNNIDGAIEATEPDLLSVQNCYIYNNGGGAITIDKGVTEFRNNEISYHGQGIYQLSGSTTIRNNNIHHNGARGINLHQVYPSTVDGNTITHHRTNSLGGGIHVYGGGPHQITNNIVSNDTALLGGGIYSFNGTNTISGNVLTNNHATAAGGGMWLQGGTNTVINNIVKNNSSGNSAGGICIDIGGDFGVIANNMIVGNTATGSAGGLQISAAKFTVVNNVIANNVAGSYAGAQLTSSKDSASVVINNTFYNNHATDANFSPNTGGMYLSNKQVKVYHNIFKSNKLDNKDTISGADYTGGPNGKNLFINNAMQLPAAKYTTGTGGNYDIGSYSSGNFFGVDPLFADESNPEGLDATLGTTDDGLQLLNNSPLIDKGKNMLFPFTITNLDVKKHARVNGDSVDLGAYEQNCLPGNISSLSQVNICKGSSTTLRVNSSAPHADVQWYADSTTLAVLDTGYYYSTPVLTRKDTFWVASNGCAGGKRVPVIVKVYNAVSSSLFTYGCDSFLWTRNNKYYKASGVYTDTLTTVWGCDSVGILQLTINHTPAPVVQNISACDSFFWDVTNKYYTANGTYSDTLATNKPPWASCDSVVILNLVITGMTPAVTKNGSALTTDPTALSYQWLKCNPYEVINGATFFAFLPTVNGSYAVIVTKDGCTDTSACITVTDVGIEDISSSAQLVIKPNPTNAMATILLPAQCKQGKLSVTNAVGQTIIETLVKDSKTVHIDLGKYPAGLYHVTISADDMRYTVRLMKE